MRAAWLVAWVLGVAAVSGLPQLPPSWLWAALAFAVLLLLLGAWRWSRLRAGLLLAAALAAGFAWAGWRADERMAQELPRSEEGRDLRVVGLITSLPDRGERGWRFEFEVERVVTANAQVPQGLWLAWFDPPVTPAPGQRWEFTVRLKRPHGSQNTGGFDLEAWMLERDLRATGYVRAAPASQLLDAFVATPGTVIEAARDRLRAALQARTADLRWGGVLVALVLGDQRAIAGPDWTLFNRSGISHLVAISGLHITMLAGLAAGIASLAWRRSRWLLARAPAQRAAALAGLITAGAYALLAGWAVPAQRTFFMLAVVAVALMLRARPAPVTTLAAAAALVCTLDPWAVSAAGFWLSFGAVAAIFWALGGRPVAVVDGRWPRLRQTVWIAVRVQVAVSLVLAPLTAWLFHQVSLVSPLANALAIPLVSWVVTPLALLASALLALPAALGFVPAALLVVADGVFALLMRWVEWLAAFGWASVAAAAPPPALVLLALAGAAWLLAPPGWPARWLGALWMAVMAVWPAPRPEGGAWWVSAIDVGQGAAVLIQTRDAAWLYDTGPRYSRDSDAGERIVLPLLRALGISRLDGLVVSHLDADHSGGAAAILAALPVARVISSVTPGSAVLGGRKDVEPCVAGQVWEQGGLRFEMLHPSPEDYALARPTNAMSCVLRVSGPGGALLLTGDLPAPQEAQLAARSSIEARLVMAPHHGSRHSSSAALVDASRAENVLVQAGYRSRYGHPAPEVLVRWQAAGARIERTDQSGLLRWELGGTAPLVAMRWRELAQRYWHDSGLLPVVQAAASDADAEPAAAEAPPEDPWLLLP